MIKLGKQIGGPVTFKPSMFMWGGCVFINFYKYSLLIGLPQFIIDEMIALGMNPYGD